MIIRPTLLEFLSYNYLHWLNEYSDVMYLVKKNKPLGKVNSGWIDNGGWYE